MAELVDALASGASDLQRSWKFKSSFGYQGVKIYSRNAEGGVIANRIKKAIFPVGGLGTRFLPATKSLPKEMLPVANKPLIQHAFEEAMSAGIEEFIFIIGRNKNAITNHFDCAFELEHNLSIKEKEDALALTRDWIPEPGNVIFIRQQHPLGLGHAIWCARHMIRDEYFAVLLADDLFITPGTKSLLAGMVDAHQSFQTNLVAVAEVPKQDINKYGIIDPGARSNDHLLQIKDMVEKPNIEDAPSNVAVMGRYILHSEIFSYLAKTPQGSNAEIQLTDAMKLMLQAGKEDFYGYQFSGFRLDCGTQIGWLEANIRFALRDDTIRAQAKELIKKIANAE